MATYVPYNEDDSSPAQPPQQLEGKFSADPSQGAPAKYTPYDPEAPALNPKQAALDTLTQPRQPWAGSYLGEAGKGVARGFVGFAKAVGQGVMPPANIIPEMYRMAPDPGIGQLKSMFDSAMAPRSDASTGEHYAGIAGEVAGGMMFPGLGAGAGASKAALEAPQAADAIAPAIAKHIEPFLKQETAPMVAADVAQPTARAATGPAPGQYALPHIPTLGSGPSRYPVPLSEKPPPPLPPPYPKVEPPPLPPPYPTAAKPVEAPAGAESSGGMFDSILSNSVAKEAADVAMKFVGIPRPARWALRYGYGALRNRMSSGSEPGAGLAPPRSSGMPARMMQGAVTPLYADDQ